MTRVFTALGQFSVRFRWLVVAAWLAGLVLAVLVLPTLGSVTQGDNTSFLDTGAPSSRAADLASPLQKAGTTSVTVVVARPGGRLTTDDQAAIARLEGLLAGVPDVAAVRDVARSPDGQVAEIAVAAQLSKSSNLRAQRTLVGDVRSAISRAFSLVRWP